MREVDRFDYMTEPRKPPFEAFLDALQVFVLEVEIQQRSDRAHGHPPSSASERVLAAARTVIETLRRRQQDPPAAGLVDYRESVDG